MAVSTATILANNPVVENILREERTPPDPHVEVPAKVLNVAEGREMVMFNLDPLSPYSI